MKKRIIITAIVGTAIASLCAWVCTRCKKCGAIPIVEEDEEDDEGYGDLLDEEEDEET